jgi:HK97 family phage prohead protease
MTDVLKYIDINPDDAKKMAQRLHIKKDEINLVRKFNLAEKIDTNESERTIVARVSTADRDRDGEIVEPKGIDLKDYQANPVLMWAHRYSDPPIGKCVWSRVDDTGLVCKFQFAKTQFADEIYYLYKEGYQKAFSIGFIPLDFDREEKIHRKSSLLEVSCVPVPCNQNARVIEAYQKGFITSPVLQKDLEIEIEPVPSETSSATTIIPPIMATGDISIDTTAPEGTEVNVDLVSEEPTDEEVLSLIKDEMEIVYKPETTDNYHRIPVSEGHSGHRIRTITISADQGIKALYCGECKKVITYLFDVDKWSMAEAQAWVDAHKEGKDMEEIEVEETSSELISEPETEDPHKSWADMATYLLAQVKDLRQIVAMLQDDIVTMEENLAAYQDEPLWEWEETIEITEIKPKASNPELIAVLEEMINSGKLKSVIDEAITVALAKMRGRVI